MSEYMTGPSWSNIKVDAPETPSLEGGSGSGDEWLTTPVLITGTALVGLLVVFLLIEFSDGTAVEESQDEQEATDDAETVENDMSESRSDNGGSYSGLIKS